MFKLIALLSFKVQISRLEPATHERETLEKLSGDVEIKPRRKRKRPGGPNPLSVLKSKKRKVDSHKSANDTKVRSVNISVVSILLSSYGLTTTYKLFQLGKFI